MDRIEQLKKEIKNLKHQIEPLEKEWRKLLDDQARAVNQKIERTERLEDKFDVEELTFAAFNRCKCGAGLAYPNNIGIQGSWNCSDILLGRALPGSDPNSKEHNGSFPFAYYDIKSDDQPFANGHTTRPEE